MAEMTFQQAVAAARERADAGLWEEAEGIFRQILAQHPGHAESWNQLGLLALRRGDAVGAAERLRRAVEGAPQQPSYRINLAAACRAGGRSGEAVDCYREALKRQPDRAEIWNNLGSALLDRGEVAEAIEALEEAVAKDGKQPAFFSNLGVALERANRLEEAVAAHRMAIERKEDFAVAHTLLGVALSKSNRWEEAGVAHRRALAIDPNLAMAHNNLGVVLRQLGNREESEAAFRKAVTLQPDYAEAHLNLAQDLLRQGCFAEGWQEYEWRKYFDASYRTHPALSRPVWDGEEGKGRTILLWAEQGFGDAIQFCRYAPLVAERGFKVLLAVRPELKRLMGSLDGVKSIVAEGEGWPDFDLQLPLMSLPMVLGTRVESIPARVPYLFAGGEAVDRWRSRLADKSTSDRPLRVGLVWAGQPSHRLDRERSLSLELLRPWIDLAGRSIRFFSLQKGTAKEALECAPFPIEDLSAELSDFSETAAAMECLDLIVSVDTAAAHLAGALGRPVWVLLAEP
ncbi:MAG: tetratricopeptide repeat protein, partial [Verrucomicrobiae bacterium]|nr:tetratricopeptide repeat protein [Verrucomicrobiae bacterium]